MFLNALLLLTNTESLFLSSEQDQLVSQVVNDVVALLVQLLDVELLDAVVALKLVSSVLLVAHLAHDLHLWAVSLDVVIQLSSGHVLKLLSVADVTTELWTLVLGMCLEFSKSLPNDLRTSIL